MKGRRWGCQGGGGLQQQRAGGLPVARCWGLRLAVLLLLFVPVAAVGVEVRLEDSKVVAVGGGICEGDEGKWGDSIFAVVVPDVEVETVRSRVCGLGAVAREPLQLTFPVDPALGTLPGCDSDLPFFVQSGTCVARAAGLARSGVGGEPTGYEAPFVAKGAHADIEGREAYHVEAAQRVGVSVYHMSRRELLVQVGEVAARGWAGIGDSG